MSEATHSELGIRATGMKFGIVAARFNETYVDALVDRCRVYIEEAGGTVTVDRVPGSGELPFAASAFARGEFDALIALGLVLKGETDHHNHLAHATGAALQQVAIDSGIPVINGIIVVNNEEEADARTLGSINRGLEFGRAAVEMAHFRKTWMKNHQ